MAQSGYTPLLIYGSGTAASVPLAANMTSSSAGVELALNYADGKLYYKNSSGVVTLLAQSAAASPVTSFQTSLGGLTPSTSTTGAITLAGTLNTSSGGTGLTTFTAGDLPYYATGTALSKLGIGTNGQLLTSSGTAPQWTSGSSITVGIATNLAGGAAGSVPYQSGASTTTFLSVGTANQVLTSSGTAPQWSSALTVTGLTDSGNLTFTGAGNRITGDFTNATFSSRTAFQTSTANSTTGIYALPSGTSTAASWQATNNSDPTNASKVLIATNGSTDVQLVSGRNGTGTYLPLTFYTNGSEQMRVDTSGNVGIGVTPSAWNTFKVVEIGYAGNSFAGQTSASQVSLSSNCYYNSGWKYANTGAASTQYYQTGGVHYWQIAPSGTAGNAITFTQAMTLDASGYLLVGATSSDGVGANRLQVGQSGGQAHLLLKNSSGHGGFYSTGTDLYQTWVSGGFLAFGNGPANGSTFTERMRIDSSGNLLVGTTTATNARLSSSITSATYSSVLALNDFAGSSGLNTFYSSLGNGTNSVANTNCYHLKAVSQGVSTYYLYGNGTTSFTSDQRLKKNIESTRNGYAEDLCKLRVVKYQWNTEPDEGSKELGLIAQEVEQVFPGLVQDAADDIQGFTPKVLKASVLPFMLLKAIQEQQAIITALQADVASLKGTA